MRVYVSFIDLKLAIINDNPVLAYRTVETNQASFIVLSDKEMERIKTLIVPDGWDYVVTDFDTLDLFVSMMFVNRGLVDDTD